VRAETFCGESFKIPTSTLVGKFYRNIESETAKSLPLCKIVSFEYLRTSPERSRGKNRLIRLVTDETDKLLLLRLRSEDKIRLTDTRQTNKKSPCKRGFFICIFLGSMLYYICECESDLAFIVNNVCAARHPSGGVLFCHLVI
jgi:hypothetical protein